MLEHRRTECHDLSVGAWGAWGAVEWRCAMRASAGGEEAGSFGHKIRIGSWMDDGGPFVGIQVLAGFGLCCAAVRV